MEGFEPETEEAKALRRRVGERRWEVIAPDAQRKATTVEEVIRLHEDEGVEWMAAVEATDQALHWSTFVNWRRRYWGRSGPAWERLLDERVPPEQEKIPEDVRAAARAVRAADRSIGPGDAEDALQKALGEGFTISESSLRRIWAEAGLGYVPKRPCSGTAATAAASTARMATVASSSSTSRWTPSSTRRLGA